MTRPAGMIRAGFPYVKTIGSFTKTSIPYDLALGQEGRIYVIGGGNSGPISIIDLDDGDHGAFGAPDFGFRYPNHKCAQGNQDWPVRDGAILRPCQIIVDEDELVYVSDEGADRISIFNRQGEFLGKWGEHGSGDGQLDRSAGIAFDANENMYVVDALNHRVQKFTKDGKFIGKWGTFGTGNGEFNMPWGITIDELGDIYIGDWRNDRVQKFDSNMNFIFKFGKSGSGDGEFNRPSGIAVDKDGDIYVADTENNRVQLFTQDARFVQQFTGDAIISKSTLDRMFTGNKLSRRLRESGSLDLEKLLGRPRSVRVDDEGHLFIADYECFRIQVYKKHAFPLGEDEIAPPLRSPVLVN